MPLKIAMIGAGSIGFTRRLMADLLTVPEFADTTFAFTDINAHNLDMVKQLAERDISGNALSGNGVEVAHRTDGGVLVRPVPLKNHLLQPNFRGNVGHVLHAHAVLLLDHRALVFEILLRYAESVVQDKLIVCRYGFRRRSGR